MKNSLICLLMVLTIQFDRAYGELGSSSTTRRTTPQESAGPTAHRAISAIQFFDLHDNRSSTVGLINYPYQLDLEPIQMTLAELRESMIGRWRLTYSCNGRRIHGRQLDQQKSGEEYYSGYNTQVVNFQFNERGNGFRVGMGRHEQDAQERMTFEQKIQALDSLGRDPDDPVPADTDRDSGPRHQDIPTTQRFSWNLSASAGQNQFKITDTLHPDQPGIVRPLRIRGTGETILQIQETENTTVCRPGEKLRSLLVRLPSV